MLLLGACGGDSASRSDAPSDPLRQPASFRETAPPTFRARFETTAGVFEVEVHRTWAPRAADRFYNLVEVGFYDGVPFHRVLDGFVAEFGIHPDPWVNAAWRQMAMTDEPVRTSNVRGRVTFSKSGRHGRTVQVFVNTDDNPELDDEGFAPFGEVVAGMEVVDALYSEYGDGPPRGEGVYQSMAIARGEEYFAEFPRLDRIERASVVDG
jgi:peptidyl-prolyl cis-trans isomerase A (cyclophilin A)